MPQLESSTLTWTSWGSMASLISSCQPGATDSATRIPLQSDRNWYTSTRSQFKTWRNSKVVVRKISSSSRVWRIFCTIRALARSCFANCSRAISVCLRSVMSLKVQTKRSLLQFPPKQSVSRFWGSTLTKSQCWRVSPGTPRTTPFTAWRDRMACCTGKSPKA